MEKMSLACKISVDSGDVSFSFGYIAQSAPLTKTNSF